MSAAKKSSLKRPVYEMPEFVAAALREHKVLKLTKPALRTNGTTTWGGSLEPSWKPQGKNA